MFIRANRRAFSAVERFRSMETVRATLFHTYQTVVGVLTFAHTRAICVWSAVRVALVAEPMSLTSLRSVAYLSLVIAGGGWGANLKGEVIANGKTVGYCVKPAAVLGAIGCQLPGAVVKT